MIVRKMIEEPEDKVFGGRNVAVLDEPVEVREDDAQDNDKAGSNQID